LAKAKGIRVNQLAKELGIPSKQILDRCKTEGLGEKVPNHMSLMSLGLAETVREWFPGANGEAGGVATAVETATEEAVEEADAKPHATPRRRKREEAHTETGAPEHDDEAEATVAEPPEELKVETPVKEAPAEAPSPVIMREVHPEAPVKEENEAAPPPPEVVSRVEVAPAHHPIKQPSPAAAPIAAPHAAAEAHKVETHKVETHKAETHKADAHKAAAHGAATGVEHLRPMRPTISINDRGGQGRPGGAAAEARVPVTPAPKMVPTPAKIQGPRVVREEKPDVVNAPRKRTPVGEGSAQPSFVQARAQGGRGVKVSDEETEDAEAKKKASKGRTLSARRRGPDGRRGEAMEKLKEYSEADLEERRIRLGAADKYRQGFDSHLKKSTERGHHLLAKSVVQRGEPVQIEEPVTIKNLAAALGVKSSEILTKLMKQGVIANLNQSLEHATAEALALDYGIELQIVAKATLEEVLEREFTSAAVDEADLRPRPPVVTILGHVDHGKTSLLDKIRTANVAAGEAGGITQHTAAWMVQLGKKRVTFIDTPGHQAFTSMRARGANMTDVVVLVVSAAEGVQPQTIESINHAKAAGVPIVVAMNKIDRPDANEQQVLGQLAAQGLNPVEWGGDTEVLRTSAVTGKGIPELIENLDYQSELLELKSNPKAPARGTVIESRMEDGMGAVATVLVQDGTLRVGDIILSGPGFGRIRALLNDRGESIQEAGASMPVVVSGLSGLPGAGDKFYVLDDMERARAIAEERSTQTRQTHLGSQTKVTLANLLDTMKAGDIKTINLIMKADTQGSIETLVKTVTDQNTEEVKVRVIHAGVGPISESDVQLAMATKTKPTDNKVGIIGFHVVTEEAARALAEQNHIDIRLYRVIYEIFDDLKKALSGMLKPEVREKLHGHVEIRQVFKVSRMGNIAGCLVTDGHIQRGSRIRLIRNGAVIVEDLSLESLKRVKDDVKDVKAGLECGIKLANYDDIKVGDRLEAYIREEFERTL
jgi:translation initiation factor IF-2